jgi:hypothetical protein
MFIMRGERDKKILQIMCMDLNSKDVMVEIGCYTGESTDIWARYFKVVYAIDPWEIGMNITEGVDSEMVSPMEEGIEEKFDLMAKKHNNIIKIKDYDKNVIDNFKDESLDFLYIDALHTEKELTRQLTLWLPKVKRTGVIGGHDYHPSYPGVIVAINNVIGYPDKIYTDMGCSWTKYKYL